MAREEAVVATADAEAHMVVVVATAAVVVTHPVEVAIVADTAAVEVLATAHTRCMIPRLRTSVVLKLASCNCFGRYQDGQI